MVERACDFCDRLGGDPAGRPWYDFRILGSTASFVVVAALGALVPGHIMIVTRDHLVSMARLPTSALNELHSTFFDWVGVVEELWGQCIAFEHGGDQTGGCVVHAHLQILPIPSAGQLPETRPCPAASFRDLGLLVAQEPYLLLWENGQLSTVGLRPLPGQYMRRVIAGRLGRLGKWDYLAFPNLENMNETVWAISH